MTKPDFDVAVDCRNMACPLPILKARKAIKNLDVGKILEVVATDPGSVSDFAGWSRQTGHPIVYQENEGPEYVYHIRKAHA